MVCLDETWYTTLFGIYIYCSVEIVKIENNSHMLENDWLGIFIEFYICDCVESIWFGKYYIIECPMRLWGIIEFN